MRCRTPLVVSVVVLAAPLCAQGDRAKESFQLALGLLQRGLAEEAATEFERFVKRNPDHELAGEAWYRLGTCRLELKKPDAARAAFTAALERPAFALRPECRYRLGLLLREQGDQAGAAKVLSALCEEVAADHYLRVPGGYALGEALRDSDQGAAAVTAFREVGKRDTSAEGTHAAPALHEAGLLLLKAKEPTAARAVFAEVEKRFPNHPAAPECRVLEGEAALRAGDAEGAAAAFLASKAVPALAERATAGLARAALTQVRAAQQKGDPATIAAAAEAGLKLEGLGTETIAELQESLGQARLQAGDAAGAEAALAAAAKAARDPALRGDALFGLAVSRHQIGRHDAAIAAAEQVLAIEPAHRLAPRAHFAIGECRFAKKEWQLADEAFAACEVPELKAKVAFKRAWCSYLGSKLPEAIERFGALVADTDASPAIAEEALAMVALAALEADRPDDALAAADRYRARFPEGRFLARSERIAARVLEKKGELRAASARLAQASAAERGSERALTDELERAELAFRQSDFESAKKLYEPLGTRTDALGGRALAGLAWCAFELGDDRECGKKLAAALAHPALGDERAGILELKTSLAERAAKWPEVEAAAREYLAAFASHEHAAELRFALAVALARQGKDAEAATELAEVVRLGTKKRKDRVQHELGWVQQRLGDTEAARAAFAKVVAESEDAALKSEAGLQLGILELAAKDSERGRATLAAVAGKCKDEARYRLGADLFAAKSWAAAAAAFTEVEAGPMLLEAKYLAAESFAKSGDFEKAHAMAQAVLAGDTEHARAQAARLVLGECALKHGDAGSAAPALEEYLRRAAKDDAERARAELGLGKARLARKEHEAAETALGHATELTETEIAAEAQFCIGVCRRERGDLGAAAEAFVKLSILHAHREWVEKALLEAGRCYTELKQPEKARKLLQELVDRFPESPSARDAKRILGV